jgi:DNA invertase Pin-like site-specific DNA recombinase
MPYFKRAAEMDVDELRQTIRDARDRIQLEITEDLDMFRIPTDNRNRRQFQELVELPRRRINTPPFNPSPPEPYAKPPIDGTSRAFGYARVSTTRQYERDNSIPDQRVRMEAYYSLQLRQQGIEWSGVIDDGSGSSARLRPFMTRPGVKKILSEIRQGDHLLIDKFDRAFRDTRDFLHCSNWFDRNQINLHILNFGGQNFQPNSPIGRMFMTMVAAFAQLEAETTSARIKDACRESRARGFTTTSPPPGTKVLKKPKGKLAWDVPKRRYMALILYMRDELYMDWKEIAWELYLIRSGGYAPTTDGRRDRWCSVHQKFAYELYAYEWFYRDCCVTDPAEIPYEPTVIAYSSAHKREMTAIIRKYRAEVNRQFREMGLKPIKR